MSYTYSKIATVTVGSGGVSSINFLAIPQNYTDLKLVASVRGTRANYVCNLMLTFNGSSSSYSDVYLYGDGSAAASGKDTNVTGYEYIYGTANSATANSFSNFEIYIPNYASGNYKTFSTDSVTESNTASYNNTGLLGSGLWANAAPITSISIAQDTATNINQYSTATLYGIKAEV